MSLSKRLMLVALPLILVSFIGISALWAQTDRGTLTGTVTDPSGAVITGATVTATHMGTGLKTSITSGAGGNYTLPLLQIGTYRVSATHAGFKEFVQDGIILDVGQTVVVPITLQIGSVTQTVEVTGQPPQLQTATTTLTTAATGPEVEELPLFGQAEQRNPAFFMVLDSSTSGRGISSTAVGQGTFTDRPLSTTVAGSQSASTEFDIDGSRMVISNWFSSNYQYIDFPQDAVQEFTLITTAPPAEIGRTGGGVVTFDLKSGSNKFHGTGFEYFRNDVLDANTFFDNSSPPGCDNDTIACRPALKQNEFGGTFGGPILKNKLFFFGWYDGFRLRQGASSSLTSVPDAQIRQGNFQAWLNPSQCAICGEIFEPSSTTPDGSGSYTRTQWPMNVIPTTSFDSVANAMLPYFPTPTNSNLVNNYLIGGSNGSTQNEEGIKIDFNLNSRNKFFGDYGESRESIVVGAADPYPPPLDEAGPTLYNIPEFRMGWDMIIASNIVNHIQYGYNRYVNVGELLDNIPGGWPAKIGYKGGGYGEFPILNFDSIYPQSGGGGGNTPGGSADNGTVIDDTVSWITGKHSFKFGMEFQHGGYNNFGYGRASGYLHFNLDETGLPDSSEYQNTGQPFASFLLGQVDSGLTNVYNAEDYERWSYYAGFIQDDFKVTHKLTLNLGVRYDLYRPTVMVHNQMSWMNITRPNPDAGGLPGVYQFANSQFRTDLHSYNHIFAPRIGLAYALNNKTVIRMNYSMIYGPGGYTRGNGDCCSDDFLGGYNDVDSLVNSSGGAFPAFVLANGWPTSEFPDVISSSPGYGINGYAERLDPADSKPYYVENRAFQVQRELGFNTLLSVGYVGNTGVHLPSRIDPANELPVQYLQYGSLLTGPIGAPAAQALAQVTAMPVDPATGNHSPWATNGSIPGFEGAMGSNATLGQALRLFPQYTSLKRLYEGVGSSGYNALDIKLNKRFSNGLSFLASYTWSKVLSDADSATSEFSGFDQDSFNTKNQKAVSLNDYPNNFVISYSYELPFGPGKHFLNQGGALGKLVGGWKISGIQQYQSGPPQEIYEGNPLGDLEGNNDNGDGDTRPNEVPGVPVTTAAYHSGHFDPNVDTELNAAAFTNTADTNKYSFGNGQQIYSNARRFPYLDEDFSLSKTTLIGEGIKVEFRADFLDAFNRAIFGLGSGGDLYGSVLFNNTIGSPAFGSVSTQSNIPREIQFGLKISF
jgi:hypothetical protein